MCNAAYACVARVAGRNHALKLTMLRTFLDYFLLAAVEYVQLLLQRPQPHPTPLLLTALPAGCTSPRGCATPTTCPRCLSRSTCSTS
jgi:hypothetical protein